MSRVFFRSKSVITFSVLLTQIQEAKQIIRSNDGQWCHCCQVDLIEKCFFLYINTKCCDIANEILNAAIESERTFKYW